MNPLVIAALAQAVSGLLEIWRNHVDKEKDWVPTAQDIADAIALLPDSPDKYKSDAAQRLGLPWPPPQA